jgi:hypothetical protein
MSTMWLSENGHAFGIRFDSELFRGGFFLTGLATLAVITAVTHQRSALGRFLGIPAINWVGTRSYGLYLYHWPIYQIIRGEAGQPLSTSQFVLALVLTIPITEASYRFVEVPIRQGRLAEILHDRRRRTPDVYQRRRRLVVAAMIMVGLVGFAGVSIAMAPNRCVGQVECDLAAASAGTDAVVLPGSTDSTPTATTTPTATPDGTAAIPQTTASTTSTSSTTSTTLPLDQRPPMAIGESVMLGAKAQLEAKGFVVDAAESRQGKDLVNELTQLRAAGRLGNTVVIHIGTNGEVSDETFAAIMANLPPEEVKAVCFLTVKADRPWIEGNNGRIVGLQSTYPNVHVGYWDGLVPTEGMASDGIHFKSDKAKEDYASLISTWTTDGPCV